MTSLDLGRLASRLASLHAAHRSFAQAFPGRPVGRQPVHVVYGGAHLFRPGTARKLGDLALASLRDHAPDPASLAAVLGYDPALAEPVYARVVAKLEREPVEDYRIDFEDGFGPRPDPEVDAAALAAADALADGLAAGSLPPFVGIRIQPLTDALHLRSLRTLDLFVTRAVSRAGRLPERFVVTLPKVQVPEQVVTLAAVLDLLEAEVGLPEGSIGVELMVETPQALLDAEGRVPLGALVRAGAGRCTGLHLGAYDLTAEAGVTDQRLDHPLCDLARQLMQLACASTGVFLADGATNTLPVGDRVHEAWRLHYRHVRRALDSGFPQGWDLHPAQLPVRYAATCVYFREALPEATRRLANFVDQAAKATRVGAVFDDAATGQGLLLWFLRALGCGAIDPVEVAATGLTPAELETRSFAEIAVPSKVEG